MLVESIFKFLKQFDCTIRIDWGDDHSQFTSDHVHDGFAVIPGEIFLEEHENFGYLFLSKLFSKGRDLYFTDIFEECFNTDKDLEEKGFNKLCVVNLPTFWVKLVDNEFLFEIFNAKTFLTEAVNDNITYFGNILFTYVKVRMVHSIFSAVVWMSRWIPVLLSLLLWVVILQLRFLDGIYIFIFDDIDELVLLRWC